MPSIYINCISRGAVKPQPSNSEQRSDMRWIQLSEHINTSFKVSSSFPIYSHKMRWHAIISGLLFPSCRPVFKAQGAATAAGPNQGGSRDPLRRVAAVNINLCFTREAETRADGRPGPRGSNRLSSSSSSHPTNPPRKTQSPRPGRPGRLRTPKHADPHQLGGAVGPRGGRPALHLAEAQPSRRPSFPPALPPAGRPPCSARPNGRRRLNPLREPPAEADWARPGWGWGHVPPGVTQALAAWGKARAAAASGKAGGRGGGS